MRGNDILQHSDKIFLKVAVIIILLRFALAAGYDCLHKEIIVPDGAFYSASAVKMAKLDIFKQRIWDREIIRWYWNITWDDYCKRLINSDSLETRSWLHILSFIYSSIGYNTLVIRFLNVFLSISSALFLYGIFRCRWALIVCLLLPTQILYSMSLCRDFMREFLICGLLWLVYSIKRKEWKWTLRN
jgi:hypothetical protein